MREKNSLQEPKELGSAARATEDALRALGAGGRGGGASSDYGRGALVLRRRLGRHEPAAFLKVFVLFLCPRFQRKTYEEKDRINIIKKRGFIIRREKKRPYNGGIVNLSM